MSATLSENAVYCTSPLMSSEKQGLVTILRSEQVNSFRRTLSADMLSEKWLAQHGLLPAMKKIASSDEISVSIPDTGETDVFGFVREESLRKGTEKKHFPVDIWSSILSSGAGEEASISPPPPYIHPLVKRSASFLSESSLEICTESLGSETGSDRFSSYSSSAIEVDGKDEEQSEDEKENSFSIRPVKFMKKDSASHSFPPPLPWLAGATVHVHSCRKNGRLTLETVLIPCQSNFLARRQNGRLVLSFADYEKLDAEEREEEIKEKESEKYSEALEEDEEQVEEDENYRRTKATQMEIMMKNAVINVHRLALMANRPNGLANNKLNEEIKSKPPLSAPFTNSIEASLNAYESYWRSKLATTKHISQETRLSAMKSSSTKAIFSKNSSENDQKMTGLRGNKDDENSIFFSKLCKEPRKSLLFWEPYCIATS